LIGFKANFRNAALARGLLPVIAFRGGYGGMVVAEDDVATIACCIRRDHLQTARRAAPGVPAGEAIERMLTREVWGVRLALADARRCGPWISAGPLALGVHLSGADKFFRIGNAAAEVHPIIGEGISMALQSAALLCAHFIATLPPQCSQDRTWRVELSRWYARQWRRAFLPRLAMAALFAHAAMRPALSATLWPLVRVWPALLTLGARGSGKIAPPTLDPVVTNLSRDADSLID
jgi:flavin-dependent dehydrogenase